MSLKAKKQSMIKLLLARQDFHEAIRAFREKWDIDTHNQGAIVNHWNALWGQKCKEFYVTEKSMKAEEVTEPFMKRVLDQDIKKIITYFGLDQYFYDFVFTYLTTGKVIVGKTKLIVRIDVNDPTSGPMIVASAFADRDDMKEAQRFLKTLLPHMPTNAKAPNDSLHTKRNLRIISMKQQGIKSRNIAQALNDELKLKPKLTATEVDKIFSRYRRPARKPPK